MQGETNTIGFPTIFIRLTGCPLRCQYCDTAYAFQGGTWYEIATVLSEVKKYRARYVTVTGGEPLAQKKCLILLKHLCDEGYCVSLETSGALDVSAVDARVVKVLDVKTPASGEEKKNKWSNFDFLSPHDQIKFVICNAADYEWPKRILTKHRLNDFCQVFFSPSYEEMSATELADWIVRDQLNVRFQIQLHKYLWGNVPGK